MATKKGEQFEILTKEIFQALVKNRAYEKVEHNVLLDGIDGTPRQIDVLIRAKVASLLIHTVIECKDHNRIIDVGKIDALHSKMQDVKANKAVMVARRGFSRGAINKAKRLGIDVFVAAEAKSNLWNIGLQIPVVITRILPTLKPIEMIGVLKIRQKTRIHRDAFLHVDDISIIDDFWEKLRTGKIEIAENQTETTWKLSDLKKPPHHIKDIDGNRHEIEDMELKCQFDFSYYFGYLNQFESARILENKIENSTTMILKTEDLTKYYEKFARYENKKLVPKVKGLALTGIDLPEINIEKDKIELKLRKLEK